MPRRGAAFGIIQGLQTRATHVAMARQSSIHSPGIFGWIFYGTLFAIVTLFVVSQEELLETLFSQEAVFFVWLPLVLGVASWRFYRVL